MENFGMFFVPGLKQTHGLDRVPKPRFLTLIRGFAPSRRTHHVLCNFSFSLSFVTKLLSVIMQCNTLI